jgi:hypothetical protein
MELRNSERERLGWMDDSMVTTHVVRLKLFRLKAEGVRRARLPYFSGNV